MIPKGDTTKYYKMISRSTIPLKKLSKLEKVLLVTGACVLAGGLVLGAVKLKEHIERKFPVIYNYFGVSYK